MKKFILLLALFGCDRSWQDRGRHTLAITAVTLTAGEEIAVLGLRTSCSGLASQEEVRACYDNRGFDDVARTITAADRTLRASQAALDAFEAAGAPERDWLQIAGCSGLALGEVLGALEAASLVIPEIFRTTLSTLGTMGYTLCVSRHEPSFTLEGFQLAPPAETPPEVVHE